MKVNTEVSDEMFADKVEDRFNLKDILQQYLKYWQWILLSFIIMLTLGILYAATKIPLYKVSITVLIKDKESGNDKDILQQLNVFSNDKIIDNEIQILRTGNLMEKVIASLDLENTYFVDKGFSKLILYKDIPFNVKLLKPAKSQPKKKWFLKYVDASSVDFDGKRIPYNHPVQTDAGLLVVTPTGNVSHDKVQVVFGNVSDIAQRYIGKLVITPASKQSTVLFLTLEDENALRGKDILTKLVDEYNQISIDDKNKTTANTLNFIEGRLSAVALELNSVEKKVQDYKSSNSITDISAQSGIFLATVQSNDAQITTINLELESLKNLEKYLSNNSDLSKLPSVQGITDAALLNLVQELAAAQNTKVSKLTTIPETNPVIGSLTDQIKTLRQTILKTLQNVRSGLLDSREHLQGQNAKFSSLIKQVPVKERGLIDVMRDRDIKNNLFTFLLQKREETLISLASTVSDSKTIDKAKSSGMFFKPEKNMLYMAFSGIGILLPVIIIYLLNVLDSTIKKRSDIERLTRVPVIAQIGYSDDPNPMIAIDRPKSMVSEQIRALRTNLQFVLPDKDQKVILFTSNISGEGKSFISLNLGASLASTGRKVIVLELDLRKPKFNTMLGLNAQLGLSNYLIGQVNYPDIIREMPAQPTLHILTSGGIPPNPAELLLNGKIEQLIDDLKKEYDFIIIDAPPIGLLTDAQILSRYAQATLFIVRFNYTRKEQIKLIEDLKYKRIFNNLNIVFNSIDKSKQNYGYGYGYGYYEEDKVKSKSVFTKILNRFR